MKPAPKLPVVFKRKWVKALRSGDYEQGKGWLLDDGKYCCLGVAGQICGAPKKILLTDSEMVEGMAPKTVLRVLNHYRPDGRVQDFLARRNDDGWSFKRIASWIERYL